MQTKNLIAVNEFCVSHNIDVSFITSLHESGLIKIISIHETVFIDREQLSQLERIIHLYFELDINLEGIETIAHLLSKIESLQNEINMLRNQPDSVNVGIM
jgi:chaperone modulatory protein CbpM